MGLGDEWTELIPGSVSKLNGMTVTYGTGAYLAGLDKTKHKLLVCNSTGSGFTLDHVYLCNNDGTTTTDISPLDASTISLNQVLYNNSATIDLLLTKTDDVRKAQWVETVTGTGNIEDNTDGSGYRNIRLRPNGTSGSGATVSYPHNLTLDFTEPSAFVAAAQIETASSLALHIGVGADDVTAADSNTRKYNAEVCTATNNNWFIRTADGSGNSTSDTGTAMSTSKIGILIVHRPDLGTPEVRISLDAAASFQKTTNIPITGGSPTANLIKFSIKNSTGADRPLKNYGSRLTYDTNASWGYGV